MTTHPHVAAGVRDLSIELPSWAFGNSGTRFKVFAQKGVPRDPYEKIADAAQVHRFTGVAPSVALHIPWDRVDDYGDLAKHAADLGVRIGVINSNVFQDDDYMLGSVTNPDPRVRRKATDHLLRLCRHHGRDRVTRPQAVVLRRHQLSRPGRHRRRGRIASPRHWPRSTRGSATISASCSSTSCSSRRSTRWMCPTGARRTRTASRSGRRRRW